VNAKYIYERIQKNKALADLEEVKRIDITVDWVVDMLCGSTTTGPHTYYAREFPAYEGSFAGAADVAERLRALGLNAIRETNSRGQEYVDVIVPVPEQSEGAK